MDFRWNLYKTKYEKWFRIFPPKKKSRNFVLVISMCRIVARSHLQILVTIIASALGLFRATNVIYLVLALSVSCGPPSRRHCLPVSRSHSPHSARPRQSRARPAPGRRRCGPMTPAVTTRTAPSPAAATTATRPARRQTPTT